MHLTLPTDSTERKNIPVLSGCLNYAPAALAGMARWSKIGNDKHNPGEPLHHARGKSMDHGDTIVRHLMDIQDLTAALERCGYPAPGECEGILKQLKDDLDALVWRAALLSQEAHEKYFGAPLAPAARLPPQQQSLGLSIGSGQNKLKIQTLESRKLGYPLREADLMNPPDPVGQELAKQYRPNCRRILRTGDSFGMEDVRCSLTRDHEGDCQP